MQPGIARKALAGFFLTGLLFSFLGVMLPVWGHHIGEDYIVIGNYFLSMNLGILAAFAVSRWLSGRAFSALLAVACWLACAALVYLALLPPGVPNWWRTGGLFFLGVAGGLLNTGILRAITPLYRYDKAATLNLAGAMFGAGCVVMAVLVAGTFYVYDVASILLLVASIPAFFGIVYTRSRMAGGEPAAGAEAQPSWRQAFRDFRSLAAVLFTLLLFFQFGNEWAVAGWLPLFLIQRLGISPESSLIMLATYWLALLVGRVVVIAALPRISRGKLLAGSVLAALLGSTMLISTNNRFGAVTAILFIGGGFASIYPLIAERIGGRFPYYHPGFFNGIFSFALTGGMLAPWSLGFFTDLWGIRVAMLLPFFGTLMVFLLLILLWAEAKFREGI